MFINEVELDLPDLGTIIITYTYEFGVNIEDVVDEDGESIYYSLCSADLSLLKRKAIEHYLDNEEEYDCY